MQHERNEKETQAKRRLRTDGATYLQFTAEELNALHYILSNYDVFAAPSKLHSSEYGAEKLERMQKQLRRKVKDAAFLFRYSGSVPGADHT